MYRFYAGLAINKAVMMGISSIVQSWAVLPGRLDGWPPDVGGADRRRSSLAGTFALARQGSESAVPAAPQPSGAFNAISAARSVKFYPQGGMTHAGVVILPLCSEPEQAAGAAAARGRESQIDRGLPKTSNADCGRSDAPVAPSPAKALLPKSNYGQNSSNFWAQTSILFTFAGLRPSH